MSPNANAFWWVFAAAALASGVILVALGVALVIYQRRFLALHRSYATSMLRAQEEERAWVAREVHDDALQRVAMVVHELGDWTTEAPTSADRQRQRVTALREEIEDLAVMLRRVAHRLHPSIVDQAGLAPALQALADDVQRSSGIEVAVQAAPVPALPADGAVILYRIAQEALRNVVKHAAVTRAQVSLAPSSGGVELIVADEGRGFTTDDSARARGLGLLSMAERTRLAEGQLEVRSAPGRGTVVRAWIPIEGWSA